MNRRAELKKGKKKKINGRPIIFNLWPIRPSFRFTTNGFFIAFRWRRQSRANPSKVLQSRQRIGNRQSKESKKARGFGSLHNCVAALLYGAGRIFSQNGRKIVLRGVRRGNSIG